MKTPCIRVCTMDPQRGVCLGCCRTLDEIMRWSGMSDAERDHVMAELPQRRKARTLLCLHSINLIETQVPRWRCCGARAARSARDGI